MKFLLDQNKVDKIVYKKEGIIYFSKFTMQQRPMKSIIENQIGVTQQAKKQQQEEDVQCCQTKVLLWDLDEYEQFESDYLNQIFPYKINKNTMTPGSKFIFHFLASSLYYWVQLVEQKEKEQGKLGIKDSKFLKQIFSQDQTDNWIAFRRWGQQFLEKQKFLKHQQVQKDYQPPKGGETIHTYKRGEQQFFIVKYLGSNKEFTEYKKRMEVLFLFYIDGVSFVNEQVDTWVYFLIFKKKQNRNLFVGALSEYVFKISTNKQRHRISQVFIMPTYQKYGHGKQLLDTVYKLSLQDPTCFQITTQIPSFQYQCLRDFKEAQMILQSKLVDTSKIPLVKNSEEINKARENILSKQVLRQMKLKLKLPGHQIERIVHIFIFDKIASANDDMPKAHFQEYLRQKIIFNRSPFKSREKLPHITFFGQSPEMKQFYLQKAKQDFLRNQSEIQQLLTQTIDGYYRVINKLHKLNKI